MVILIKVSPPSHLANSTGFMNIPKPLPCGPATFPESSTYTSEFMEQSHDSRQAEGGPKEKFLTQNIPEASLSNLLIPRSPNSNTSNPLLKAAC